jgi:hypothetical protein
MVEKIPINDHCGKTVQAGEYQWGIQTSVCTIQSRTVNVFTGNAALSGTGLV